MTPVKKDSLPFIKPETDLQEMAREYKGSEMLRKKIEVLRKKFPTYMPIRGDGNGFYRAVLFGFLTKKPKGLLEKWDQCLDKALQRYSRHTNLKSTLKELEDNWKTLPEAAEKVVLDSDDLVHSLRLVCADFIEGNEEWAVFIDSGTVSDVLKMGQEAEGLALQALSSALGVAFDTVYLQDDGKDACPIITVQPTADAKEAVVATLLLRPGHYDVLIAAAPASQAVVQVPQEDVFENEASLQGEKNEAKQSELPQASSRILSTQLETKVFKQRRKKEESTFFTVREHAKRGSCFPKATSNRCANTGSRQA